MNDKLQIRTGQSCAEDSAAAVSEFFAAVSQPHMAQVIFFCSSNYDLTIVAAEMNRLFAGTYMAYLWDLLQPWDAWATVLKTTVFGMIIGASTATEASKLVPPMSVVMHLFCPCRRT